MYLYQMSQDELDDAICYYLSDEKTLDALYCGEGLPEDHLYVIYENESTRRFFRDLEVEAMANEGHAMFMEEQCSSF